MNSNTIVRQRPQLARTVKQLYGQLPFSCGAALSIRVDV